MKRTICAILALVLLFGITPGAGASSDTALQSAYSRAAAFYTKQSQGPVYGGEFAAIGLIRGGAEIPPGWRESYYGSVENALKLTSGVLSERKHTEYSRVILALTSLGYDPADVSGYNLTLPLGDYEKTLFQGINGPVWALLALDSGGYELPLNPSAGVQASREAYIDHILSRELTGGGWALSGNTADPDITAMALCALAKYRADDGISPAIGRALDVLSAIQLEDGGYTSPREPNCESAAQVLIALCAFGIDIADGRFVKNQNSVLNNLLSFQLGDGSFEHIKGGGFDAKATEQALCALAAAKRAKEGGAGLFGMVTFKDISNHEYKNQIEALANAGIINGITPETFAPGKTMTRAEFSSIVAKALGLKKETVSVFADVKGSAWYSGYVGAAYGAGIIKGSSPETFTPEGTITDVEAKIMLSRAAVLFGLTDSADEAWRASSVNITRCEVARDIYNLLKKAGKL